LIRPGQQTTANHHQHLAADGKKKNCQISGLAAFGLTFRTMVDKNCDCRAKVGSLTDAFPPKELCAPTQIRKKKWQQQAA
jgi:hypothetical protein